MDNFRFHPVQRDYLISTFDLLLSSIEDLIWPFPSRPAGLSHFHPMEFKEVHTLAPIVSIPSSGIISFPLTGSEETADWTGKKVSIPSSGIISFPPPHLAPHPPYPLPTWLPNDHFCSSYASKRAVRTAFRLAQALHGLRSTSATISYPLQKGEIVALWASPGPDNGLSTAIYGGTPTPHCDDLQKATYPPTSSHLRRQAWPALRSGLPPRSSPPCAPRRCGRGSRNAPGPRAGG